MSAPNMIVCRKHDFHTPFLIEILEHLEAEHGVTCDPAFIKDVLRTTAERAYP